MTVELKPTEFTRRAHERLARAEEAFLRLEAQGAPFTRRRVLEPLNELALDLANVGVESGLIAEVHPDREVRGAAESASQELEKLATRIHMSRPVYEALGAIADSELDPLAQRARFLIRRDMKRAGVELSEAERGRVRQLREELVLVEQEFSRVIREDVRSITADTTELEGLPEDFIAAHPPGRDGKVKVTTDYPDYIPFMTYAKSQRARRELMRVSQNRGVPRNLEVLKDMLAKRHELARLLGYETWADYATEDKMAESAQNVRDFIEKAYGATRASGKAELAELLDFKRRDFPGAERIGSWEAPYYTDRVKAERYDFDTRAVRPYFEYRSVKQAILDLASELFGIAFTPASFEDSWHPSVETFDVTMDGQPLGRISLDMHPRDGKFNHAACFAWREGIAGRQLPHSVLVCNFPDPAKQKGPALMQHQEVVTFFHEFGHLVHALMRGRNPWVRLIRPAEWDFIEAPSQFLEEWIFDFEVLRRFAKHVETGETIPAELVERLRQARDFGRGVLVQRQLFLSAVSLWLHDRDPKDIDTGEIVSKAAAKYSPFEQLEGTRFEAAFGHLEGYTSAYYTYMLSLTISKDLASQFTSGLMDLDEMRRYRDLILAPGGTKPAAELVRDFLGRDFSFDAFREWLAPKPA